MTSELERFLSYRIAEDEALCYRTIASQPEGFHRLVAERELMECSDRRWALKFYDRVSHSGEPGSGAAWETLKQVLIRMAKRWDHHPDYQPSWASPDL